MHLIQFISDTKEVHNINIKHWRPVKTKRNIADFSLNVVYISFSVGCFLFNPIKGFLPFKTNVFKYSNMFNTVLKMFYYVCQGFYKLLPVICNHNITLSYSCKHEIAKYKFSYINVLVNNAFSPQGLLLFVDISAHVVETIKYI